LATGPENVPTEARASFSPASRIASSTIEHRR
jgi:hypothetical protein